MEQERIIIDAITLEDVPINKAVTIVEGNGSWTVNVTTLVRMVADGDMRNPFTRSPLSHDLLDIVSNYRLSNSLTVTMPGNVFSVDHFRNIGYLLLQCLRENNILTQISHVRVITDNKLLDECILTDSVEQLGTQLNVSIQHSPISSLGYNNLHAFLTSNRSDLLHLLVEPHKVSCKVKGAIVLYPPHIRGSTIPFSTYPNRMVWVMYEERVFTGPKFIMDLLDVNDPLLNRVTHLRKGCCSIQLVNSIQAYNNNRECVPDLTWIGERARSLITTKRALPNMNICV